MKELYEVLIVTDEDKKEYKLKIKKREDIIRKLEAKKLLTYADKLRIMHEKELIESFRKIETSDKFLTGLSIEDFLVHRVYKLYYGSKTGEYHNLDFKNDKRTNYPSLKFMIKNDYHDDERILFYKNLLEQEI